MSETSTADPGKPMKQPSDDLSKAMGQLSVTTIDSDKNSPSLSDMPIDVVGLIIDRSEYKHQLKLRKVSKSLRSLVDKQKPACKSIKVECCPKKVYITFNGHTVTYSRNLNNVRLNNNAETSINIVRDDFKKVAFDDLASALKNPKLQLEEFIVFNFTRNKNEIRNVLKSLNHQVSVKKIDIMVLSHSCLFSVLPFMKPGVLKKISIFFDLRGPDWRILARMEQVALLEQWKQAEELELKNALNGFQMEYATHLKRFHFFESVIDGDKLIRIRDFLSELDNFEHFFFSSFLPYDAVELLAVAGRPAASKQLSDIVYHYSIPGSDDYLEFVFLKKSVEIRRIKRS